VKILSANSPLSIKSIRLFEDSFGFKVALYGTPSKYQDGWIENVSIDKVFTEKPHDLEVEKLYKLVDISPSALTPQFCSIEDGLAHLNPQASSSLDSTSPTYRPHSSFGSIYPLVLFPHFPRTGGNILFKYFTSAFGDNQCLRITAGDRKQTIRHIAEADLPFINLSGYNILSGNISLSRLTAIPCVSELVQDGKTLFFTSVRDPIDRLISMYNYIRIRRFHPRHRKLTKLSLEDFILNEPENYQFTSLKIDQSDNVQSIIKRVDVFPIEKSVKGLRLFLERHFDINTGDLPLASESKSPDWACPVASIHDLSFSALEEARAKNNLDIELYHEACNLRAYL
jgi:hypothetical protein